MRFRSDPRDGFQALLDAEGAGYKAVFCVTTNLQRHFDGRAIMGAGIAKAAAQRVRGLDRLYGDYLHVGRSFVRIGNLIMFPTKRDWRKRSDIGLIAESSRALLDLAKSEIARQQLDYVLMPPVGCGNGGLDWHDVVKPLVTDILEPIAKHVIFLREPRAQAR